MTGYDCTNIPGVGEIPQEAFPMGAQTECFLQGFPECTFNGGFVDVDKAIVLNAGASSVALGASMALAMAVAVAVFGN